MTPKVSASDQIDRLLAAKWRALRWNVETIGFSPNGFNAYFLFKVLLVLFTVLVMLQGVAFFYRSYLEWKEGEDSANKYLDKDQLGDEDAELVAEIHSGAGAMFGLDGVEIGRIIVFLCLFGGILSGFPVAFAIGIGRDFLYDHCFARSGRDPYSPSN